ncbi:MAG: hypothetical protein LBP73_07185 [Clostridiales Family XIII bacterium]|nr:hypothetical protein [Clostridiales Family XIII bacterium]
MGEHAKRHDSGADMWREYCAVYGEDEARGICNRYLDMQVFAKDTEEVRFCRQLYAAMNDPEDECEWE